MQIFDASSMIYAWDNYPYNQFPGLWDWLSTQISSKNVGMSVVALEEVGYKMEECADWLKRRNVLEFPITNQILEKALEIQRLLGIDINGYHKKGVDENDIFIIATGVVNDFELVSDELQLTRPNILNKSKIPSVCSMKGVGIQCIRFIDYIKRDGVVFR